jgi:tetratricopeptide (TPR) repeat protein
MRARSFWSHGVIGSGLLLAVATTVPALAQSASGTATPYPAACSSVPQSESERAHTIYQAGKVQYDDKNYEAAIAQFREAYKRDCSKHDLLIIISRAYELNGNRPEALRALELYLERVPNSPDATTHRNGIESLKRQIAAAPPPTATTPAPSATTTTAPPPAEVREHSIPPWLVVGLGGAAVVTGAIILVAAPAVPANCDTTKGSCTPTGPTDDIAKDQRQAGTAVGQRTGGLITVIGGAGLIGIGLLWHFLEPTGPVERTGSTKPSLAPAVAPGYAGMSLGGSF